MQELRPLSILQIHNPLQDLTQTQMKQEEELNSSNKRRLAT